MIGEETGRCDDHVVHSLPVQVGQMPEHRLLHQRGQILPRGQCHHRGDFCRILWKHGHAGAVLFDDERVALVNGQIGMRIQYAIGTQQAAKVNGKIGGGSDCHIRLAHSRLMLKQVII